jgi:hypothetical protein
VSLAGNDANPGTLAQPFATFEKARDAVRQAVAAGIPAGGIVVWIRGGAYERAATLALAAADSGKTGAPVVYRGYPGEQARLVGGKRLDPSWFSTVTSAAPVWSRLDPTAQGKVVQATLKDHGITDFGTLATRGFGDSANAAMELSVNGVPMTLARWPDVSATDPKSSFVSTADPITATSFGFTDARTARWGQASTLSVHGFWGNAWADEHLSAQIDNTAHTVTLSAAPNYALKTGQPFYAENLLEEITVPGEWYLDRTTGILYLWPPSDIASADIVVSILGGPLVSASNASYVTWRDLVLEATRSTLIEIKGGSHDALEGLVLRNSGTDAASVNGSNHLVHHCLVSGTGESGIKVSGGDRPSLTPANNVVDGCHIHDFARWVWTYNPAIDLDGVANVARHNSIHDAPHAAMLYHGNENLIELNEIHDVVQSSSDAGAIYSGRDWGFRGNIIRNNFIHHISTWQSGPGAHGIYLDDTLAGISVEGNVLYSISGAGLKHGGGRDDIFVNNVVARCGDALATDNRASTGDMKYNLLSKLEAMNYQQDPWKSRYPACAAIPDSWATLTAAGSMWLYPQGTVFSRNIGWMNTKWISGPATATGAFAEIANDVENQDPLFVDEAHLNLALRPGSPALSIPGFVDIPFAMIGIQP